MPPVYIPTQLSPINIPTQLLGWTSDRDAQHCPLTENATKGQEGGVKAIHFAKFWQNKANLMDLIAATCLVMLLK